MSFQKIHKTYFLYKSKNKVVRLFTDLWLFGGGNNPTPCYSFSLSSQQWTKHPDLPSSRYGHGSVVVDSCIFIVGGQNNYTIDKLDRSTNSFETVARMKESRYLFASCCYKNNSLLVAGARVDNQPMTSNCFLFDTSTETFEEFASLNVRICGHVLVNFNGLLYSIGGKNEKCEVLDSIELFEEGGKQWKFCDFKLNIARFGHQFVVHKNHIYMVGGWCAGGRRANTVERIDVNNGKVDLLEVKLPVARGRYASCKFGPNVYIFGTTKDNTSSVEILNLDTMEVQEGVSVPISDYGFSACVL